MNTWRWLVIVGAFVAGTAVSYWLALLGHPEAFWLWCEVLNICGSAS